MAHVPVLLQSSVDALAIAPGHVVIDGTLGTGGHSAEILKRFGSSITLIAIDKDAESIARAKTVLAPLGGTVRVINDSFAHIETILRTEHIPAVNGMLLDLGWNTDQLSEGRGFSFQNDEPLDMNYHAYDGRPEGQFTAADVVNNWSEESIANVLYAYGEERYARRIAKVIVERRAIAPIMTTHTLVDVIRQAVPAAYRHGRLHPATRSFQALRIVVNDELGELKKALVAAVAALAPGGRLAVITFHSLEDRIVKQTFRDMAHEDVVSLITKKPVVASPEELSINPRARSAKLRTVEKSLVT